MTKVKYILMTAILCLGFLIPNTVWSGDDTVTLTQAPVTMTMVPLKFKGDPKITFVEASQCLCETDMKDYVNTMVPKYLIVRLWNDSPVKVDLKLTVRWYSYYRKNGGWNTVTRNITLDKNRTRSEIIFGGTYYDTIKASSGIEAKIEIVSTNFEDTNTSNNTMKITACNVFIE